MCQKSRKRIPAFLLCRVPRYHRSGRRLARRRAGHLARRPSARLLFRTRAGCCEPDGRTLSSREAPTADASLWCVWLSLRESNGPTGIERFVGIALSPVVDQIPMHLNDAVGSRTGDRVNVLARRPCNLQRVRAKRLRKFNVKKGTFVAVNISQTKELEQVGGDEWKSGPFKVVSSGS